MITNVPGNLLTGTFVIMSPGRTIGEADLDEHKKRVQSTCEWGAESLRYIVINR